MTAAAAATAPPMPTRSTEAAERQQWYLGKEGERRGPYAFTEIVAMAGADRVDTEDLLWRPGFRQWVPAESIAGLLSPPPIPPMQPGRAPRPVPAPQPRPSADWEWARAAVATLDNSVSQETHERRPEPAPQAPEAAQAIEEESAIPAAVFDALSDAVPVEEEHGPPVAAEPTPAATPPAPEPEAQDTPNSETERLRSLVGGLAAQTVEPKRSYIARHWHGELSFTRSLFVNGVLPTAAIVGAYGTIALWGSDLADLAKPALAHSGLDLARWSSLWEKMPLWLVASTRLASWLAIAGIYVWSIVGIIRAARNRA